VQRTASFIERFWTKVDRSGGPDSCWPWRASTNPDGYGMVGVRNEGRTYGAHRIAYELTVGPIPAGLTLDHRCHTDDLDCAGGRSCAHRACVNPAHLEPVTNRENILRSRSNAIAANRDKAQCPAGHAYDEANTFIVHDKTGRHRKCRACRRQQKAAARAHARTA